MKLKVFILSTGSEITDGRTIDTNSIWIANEMNGLGFPIEKIVVLPDDPLSIKQELDSIVKLNEKSLVIITGGLGTTEDDYTLSTICTMLKVSYLPYQPSLDRLLEFAKERGKQYSDLLDIIKRQTCVPEGSTPLKNDLGIATGFIVNLSDRVQLVAMPGVPNEMMAMFSSHFLPIFKERYGVNDRFYIERYIWLMGESIFQSKFITNNVFINSNIQWGVTAKPGYIKTTFTSNNKEALEEISKDLYKKIENVYEKDILLELHKLLAEKKKTLATAESCTGGLVAKNITDRPGASTYYLGSVVSYHNDVKQNVLKVSPSSLEKYGAVSKEVASEMAIGLENLLGSACSISVTGIAGPGGATETKKMGLVFIGIKVQGEEPEIHKFHFPLRRELFREYVANTALYLLYKKLVNS
jgi:nicotinamide-nucleotide amidase